MRKFNICNLFIIALISQNISAQIKTVRGVNVSGQEMDAFIRKEVDSLQISALSIAVIKGNKVVYSKAIGTKNTKQEPIDENTIFEAASMTKPMFSYTVLQLVKEGILNLDTPLYQYFPYPDIAYDDRYKLITARMVLDHTTGFPNWRENNKLTINFTPGTKFGYSGEGYGYLAFVVEHLTGKTIDQLVEKYVMKPMSIKNSYLVFNDYINKHLADGIKDNNERGRNEPYIKPHAAYSLYTESKKYAKFIIELIRESYILNSTFQSMVGSQVEIHEEDMDPNLKINMGLGVYVQETPYGLKYSHGGSNGNCYNSLFQFYKDSKVGFVYFIAGCKQGEFAKRLDQFMMIGK
ncbi:serine hydrolase domain-containing protein [Chryseobacterium sp. ISL-6]|uniref:serine hydrolase domain-containing protein n=1 Tax=Chryseobacterium sp. ISL-6 TaxID=2819143 RepID=UPI001BECB276|nr:serine hydrolase domain-containing protein [Chryseobacterium sp. ISL-6]MBT2622557.1 beta-lactamase family protein [Chryseobacterium sp. ISL-6]